MALDNTDTLAAAPAAPEEEFAHVDLDLIVESVTNPRHTFKRMPEITETIRQKGVVTPILLRPLPGWRMPDTFGYREPGAPLPIYELVSGARRLRGSRMAKRKTIPAMIRVISDRDAREIQHIENIQREDVDKLEEAESFRSLRDEFGMSAEDIANKIRQSKGYVYSVLKLLDLCQVGRQALSDESLDFSKALAVSRIPSEAQQLKAIKDLTERNHSGDFRIGARETKKHIRQHYMLELGKARFDIADASLVPAAGACPACPKRTGANPELYSDEDSADLCTDSPCFHGKETAHAERVAEEAKAKGQTVIVGKEAEELTAHGYSHHSPKLKGYRRLDNAEDSPTDQPLRKIIGKQMEAEGIVPVKIENPRQKGEFIDCLPNEVANALIKTVMAAATAKAEGQKKAAVSKEVQRMVDEKKAKADARAKAQYEQAWRDALVVHTSIALAGGGVVFSEDIHRYLARAAAASLSNDDAERVAVLLGLGKVGAHSAVCDFAKTTKEPDALHLLIIAQRTSSATDHGYGGRPANEGLLLVARAALKDHLATTIVQMQEAAKEKYLSAPVESAAPKSASTPKPAAQATTTRAQGKGKKGSAAQAPATAKTTAKEASAQIAAALAVAEATNQAPAAQGNEGLAVADAQPSTAPSGSDGGASEAHDQAPTAQGDEAPPAAPAPAAVLVLRPGGYAIVSGTHHNENLHGRLVKLMIFLANAQAPAWMFDVVGGDGRYTAFETELTPAPAPTATDSAGAQAPDQAPSAQSDEAPPAAPAPATPPPTTKASARAKKGAASTEATTQPDGAWPFPKPANAPAAAPAATPAPAVAIELAEGVHVRVNAHVYAAEKEAYAGLAGKVLGPLKGFKGTWRVEFSGELPPGAKATSTFKAQDLEVIA
ncbi:MAG: ParB/RepB/Spo0J family partition protein [Acidovorax sp.]